MEERRPRNSAKAILFDREKKNILFLEHADNNGTYFTMPGGGQQRGENLHQSLQRECMEEIGTAVEIVRLCTVRDYIAANHARAIDEAHVHQVEFYFACVLAEPTRARVGDTPDTTQRGIRWMPVEDALNVRLYPEALQPFLRDIANGHAIESYLGDVN